MSSAASEQRFTWTQIFSEAARKIGGSIGWADSSDQAGEIVFPDGRRLFYHKGVLGLNGVAAARIARDKHFAAEFLAARGFNVPEERLFFRQSYARREAPDRGPEAAEQYAAELGYPVFVKPVHLSQGRGVAKVFDSAECDHAIRRALEMDTAVVVQRACAGVDIRIVVVDGKVVDSYTRTPLEIVGSGRHSVSELIQAEQFRFDAEGRDTVIDLNDWRVVANLRRANLTLADVLVEGQRVRLHDIANLSVGGSARMEKDIPSSLAALAIAVSAALSLRFCGVDFIIDPDAKTAPIILEVNSAPGMDNYFYLGRPPFEYLTDKYAEVLAAVGPVATAS